MHLVLLGIAYIAFGVLVYIFARWVSLRRAKRLDGLRKAILQEDRLDELIKFRLIDILRSHDKRRNRHIQLEDLAIMVRSEQRYSPVDREGFHSFTKSNLYASIEQFIDDDKDPSGLFFAGPAIAAGTGLGLTILGLANTLLPPLLSNIPVSSLPGGVFVVQRVFYGTDRAIEHVSEAGPVYGYQRSEKLTLGYADVTIPTRDRDVGSINFPNEVTVFKVRIWKEAEDRSKHFTIHEIVELSPREISRLASTALSNAKAYPSTAFVFIHGFNTPFRFAVFRTAQLAWDLRFDGPAFLYSWPSVGHTEDYVTDIDAAEEAAPFMDEFFDLVLSTPGIEHVHIVAHSMGNAALAELFKKAGTRLAARKDVPFDEIILASPDINVRNFRQVSEHFDRLSKNVTLYASSTDKALFASKKLRSDFVRLGDVGPNGPAVLPGVYSIDVSSEGTEIFSLNHSTYADSKLIINDLGLLFRFGFHPPDHRNPVFRSEVGANGRYWYVPN